MGLGLIDDCIADTYHAVLQRAVDAMTRRLDSPDALRHVQPQDLPRLDSFELQARRAACYTIAGLLTFDEDVDARRLIALFIDHLAAIDEERGRRSGRAS